MASERAHASTSRQLGRYLGCAPEDIEEALSRQSLPREAGERRPRIGELLLDMDIIDMDALLDAVRAQRIDRLRACALFASLSVDELGEISAVFQEVSEPPSSQFITQDEDDPCLYVLASGSCKVFRIDDAGKEIPLARLFPGEPVGEMGYFANGIRSASVRALDPVQLLRASYDDLSDCFAIAPDVAAAFMQVVTQRLRNTNVLYQEARFDTEHEEALSPLAGVLELEHIEELESGGDRLLVRMVHAASSVLDAERASLFLLDRDTGEIWSKVAQGAEIKEIRIPAGTGIVGYCIENNETVNVDEAYDDDRFNPEVDRRTGFRTHTILCAPVRNQGGRAVGAVQVINKSIGVFTEDDESLLRAVASQASVAVENINLYRDVVSDYRRLAALLEVTAAVAPVSDRAALALALGPVLARVFDCERAQVLSLDEDEGELWTVEPGNPEPVTRRYLPTEIPAGAALLSGEVVNVADVYDDEHFDAIVDERDERRTRCVLAAPVRTDGDAAGLVLNLANRNDGVFEDDDVDLLTLVCSQLAPACARLLR